MLDKQNCKGIWSGITIPWKEDYNFNDKRFAYDCEKICEAGVPGIYTTGSSGESYALDFDEFKYMVDVFSDTMKNKSALAVVGCHDVNTRDAMKKMDYVAKKGVIDGVQFAFPFWLKMNENECYNYINEICTSFPTLGFWHYNTERSKVKFIGKQYIDLINKHKNLVATKWTDTDIFAYCELSIEASQLNHFVGEEFLLYGMMNGAVGSCSSLVNGNPKLILEFYRLCLDKQWVLANEIQKKINRWFIKVVIPLIQKGYLDPVIDKAIAYIGGYNPPDNIITRKPYKCLSKEELMDFQSMTQGIFPEFIYKG